MTLDVAIRVRRGRFDLAVDVGAESGTTVAIVGPNGAGKSTLLRAIAGVQPATGRVGIDGADVSTWPAHRRSVGWVPQDGALFPHLTARDNVAFGCGGRRGHPAAMSWLERMGIAELADRTPSQLSGGQAQKVALARALARRPRVLLLDEPLASLDRDARTDVRATLRRHLADFDGVALLVTHDEEDAAALSDRVVRIDDGRLVP